jgi:hypothetical protein
MPASRRENCSSTAATMRRCSGNGASLKSTSSNCFLVTPSMVEPLPEYLNAETAPLIWRTTYLGSMLSSLKSRAWQSWLKQTPSLANPTLPKPTRVATITDQAETRLVVDSVIACSETARRGCSSWISSMSALVIQGTCPSQNSGFLVEGVPPPTVEKRVPILALVQPLGNPSCSLKQPASR